MTVQSSTEAVRLQQLRAEEARGGARGPQSPAEFAQQFASMLQTLDGGADGAAAMAGGGSDGLSAGEAGDSLIRPPGGGRHRVSGSMTSLIAQGGFDSVSGGGFDSVASGSDSVSGGVAGLDGAASAGDRIGGMPPGPPPIGGSSGGHRVGAAATSLMAAGGFDSVTGMSADSVSGGVANLNGAAPAGDRIGAGGLQQAQQSLAMLGGLDAQAPAGDAIRGNRDMRWMTGLLAEG